MSGRRRRDDEWGDGRLDAQDDRRDPWADEPVGDWGDRGTDHGDDANRSGAPSGGGYASQGGAAGAYALPAPLRRMPGEESPNSAGQCAG